MTKILETGSVDQSKLPLHIQKKKGSKIWWVNTKTGGYIHKDNLKDYVTG